jgi:hypothetical protein
MKEPRRYNCGNGEGMFEDEKSGHWIEYAEHKAIVEELNQALHIHDVVGRSEQLVCSCGSRLVKTTGGYHCGNAKCSF